MARLSSAAKPQEAADPESDSSCAFWQPLRYVVLETHVVIIQSDEIHGNEKVQCMTVIVLLLTPLVPKVTLIA
jgi:hypothetical protein